MLTARDFSRLFDVAQLGSEPAPFEIEASPEERVAVARRLDLIDLDELRAQGTVASGKGGVIRVRGVFSARFRQRCVVTLKPVSSDLILDFDRLFLRSAGVSAMVEVDPEEEEPEPLIGDLLDLGELVTEELSLGMDPYPRAENAAEFLERFRDTEEDSSAAGPLAEALRRWQRGD